MASPSYEHNVDHFVDDEKTGNGWGELKVVNLLTTQAGSEINQASGQKRDKITQMIKM